MLGDSFKLPTRINILLPKNTDLLLVQKFIEVKNCPLQDHHLISNDSQFSTFHFWRIRAFFWFQRLHSREHSVVHIPFCCQERNSTSQPSDLDGCTMSIQQLFSKGDFSFRHQKNYRSCFCRQKDSFFWQTWWMRFSTQITRCFLNPSVDLLQPKNRHNDPCLAFGTPRHLGVGVLSFRQ